MSRNLVVWACALSVGIVAVRSASQAADEPTPAVKGEAKPAESGRDKPRTKVASKPEQAIEAALNEPTVFEFVDTPLKDVTDYLKNRHGIEIQLDNKALGEANIAADTPITKSLKGVSLRSALKLTLAEKGLTYVIDHEVLLITTEEVAKTLLSTRVYDVHDLLSADSSDDTALEPDSAIVHAITTCLGPGSWASAGGTGSICLVPAVKSIVVSQNAEVHEQIAELLADLRARLPAHDKSSTNQPSSPHDAQAAPSEKSVVFRVYTLSPPDDEAATDRYVAVIRDLIEPKSWTDSNGYLRALSGKIAVRNTPAVQARVKRLLEELGAIAKEGGGMFQGPIGLKPDFGIPGGATAPPTGPSAFIPEPGGKGGR